MKRLLPIATLASIALTLTPVILAQDSTAIQRLENRQRETFIASRAAELKTKLQTFKNQVKAQVAERVSANLNKINTSRVATMNDNLQKMTAILDKLEKKTTKASSSGQSNASSSAAIAKARAAITTAQKAVNAQSEKDYTITVTTEGKIGIDAKADRDQLLKDLQGVKKLVIDAKQSVAEAIAAVKSGGRAK